MNYYKITCGSPTEEKAKSILSDASECESVAEALAKKCGALSYMPSIDADFGGISAFEFDKFSRKRWGGAVELIKTEDGVSWFAPKVEVKEKIMLSDKAEELASLSYVLVTKTVLPFALVAPMLTRKEVAEMAGIVLKEKSVEQLLRELKADTTSFARLRAGLSIDAVFPEADPALLSELERSQEEDKHLCATLSEATFRRVYSLSGNHRAIRLYKDMFSLPIVPRGTLSAVLQLEHCSHVPGIAEWEGSIYVKSGATTLNRDLIHVPENVWNFICEQIKIGLK